MADLAEILARPSRFVLVLVLAIVARRIARRVIRRTVARWDAEPGTPARKAQRVMTLGAALRGITSTVIWSIAVLMMLGEVGVDLGPVIAGAGIAGAALAFGAQTLVRDFLTGAFLLVEDQFGVGDVIDTGVAMGTVEAVSLRSTRLRDADGVVWFIPNSEIHKVGNHTLAS